MIRTVLFTFDDDNSTGVFGCFVPSLINIKDHGGSQVTVYLTSKTGLTKNSTVGDMMADTTLYKTVSKGAKHTYDIKHNTMHIEIF